MDGLTTGSALYIDSDSSSTSARNIVEIINNNTAATGATALALQSDAGRGLFIDSNLAAGGFALEIDSELTTTNTAKISSAATSGTTLEIESPGVLTGTVLSIGADGATTGTGINMSMDGLTTGSALAIDSDSSSTATRNIASIIQNHSSASGSTTLYLQNDHATANALKVQGASTLIGALTVGADDTGHNVRFYGATSGRYVTWEQSADSLNFVDNTKIMFGTGTDMSLYHDASDSYITNAVGALKIATETSGIAVSIGHTTSEVTVNHNLTVTGKVRVIKGSAFQTGLTAGWVLGG